MEYGYSILMGIFAGLILIYAGLMALTKDYKMLPFRARVSVQPKDEKRYMKQLAKVVALVALAPALSVLIVSAVVFIWLGTKIMRGVE